MDGEQVPGAFDGDFKAAMPSDDSLENRGLRARLSKALFGAELDPVRIGRFVILDRLGQGGMGVVYSAYDPELDRRVALKLLRSGYGGRAHERLLREARALARLSHPNVVPVHDVGVLDGRVFIVMEFVQGLTLGAFIRAEQCGWREVLRLYQQAGRGLVAAHDNGLIHRDFKPENVLVGEDGRVRVLDFGLARGRYADEDAGPGPSSAAVGAGGSLEPSGSAFEQTLPIDSDGSADLSPESDVESGARVTVDGVHVQGDDKPNRRQISADAAAVHLGRDARPGDVDSAGLVHQRLTQTGAMMGTPAYMSPEQFAGRVTGPATDQFSFCASLFEGLYGHRPFAGSQLAELMDNVTSGTICDVKEQRGVPAWVYAVIRRGLATDPDERYSSLQALLDALERDPARTRRRWLVAAGAVALCVLSIYSFTARSPAAAVAPCQSAPAEIAQVWNQDRRQVVERAIMDTGRVYASEVRPRVLAGLDGYAETWIAMHRDACMAHQRGNQSGALLDRRMACLDGRRVELASAVQVLAETDAESLDKAIELVQNLASLDYCGNVEALEAEVPPPDDAQVAGQVRGLRARLSRATALHGVGRYQEALSLARDVESAAEPVGYQPLVADALLAQGRAHIAARALEQAIFPLHRAMLLGFAAGANRTALEALALRIFAQGPELSKQQELRAYMALAEVLVEQLPDNNFVHGLLLNNMGATYMVQGEREQARRYFVRALAIKEGAASPDPSELGHTLLNLALISASEAERVEILKRVVDLRARSLGPVHPETLSARVLLGQFINSPERARALLEPACALTERHHRGKFLDLFSCFYELSHVRAELGAYEAAAEALSHVVTLVGPDEPAPDIRESRALASAYRALYRGDHEAALATWHQIAGDHESSSWWWDRYIFAQCHLGIALAERELGRREAAVRSLEQALPGFEDAAQASQIVLIRRLRARARVTLASELWPVDASAGMNAQRSQDHARAIALIADAERWYRTAGDGYDKNLADLATWRERRGLTR